MKKEERIKLYKKTFKVIFVILLLTFSGLYFSVSAGYYNYNQRKKVIFTEEKIKQFEKDVQDGKNVLIENYLEGNEINYQNKTSNFGLKISKKIEQMSKKGIEGLFGMIEKLVSG